MRIDMLQHPLIKPTQPFIGLEPFLNNFKLLHLEGPVLIEVSIPLQGNYDTKTTKLFKMT